MNWLTIIGDISNVIATALAAYSIYITIKEQKSVRRSEKNRIIIDQNLNWYNEVAINDIYKSLLIFIDKSEQALDACKGFDNKDSLEKNLKSAYDNIKDNYKILNTRLILLKVFSVSLYNNCNSFLQKILDLYSDVINDASTNKRLYYNKNERNIQEERVNMIKELYLYKINFVYKDE